MNHIQLKILSETCVQCLPFCLIRFLNHIAPVLNFLQAIIFLEYVSGYIEKKKSDSGEVTVEAAEVEITKFLEMLVNHVDLKAGNSVDLLRALQQSKAKYRKVVANTVSF